MFRVSNNLLFCLTRIAHLTKPPLPLPIREFFDFFVNGKFGVKKNQIFFFLIENGAIFDCFIKFFRLFLKNLKYNDSTVPDFLKKTTVSPYFSFVFSFFFPKRRLKLRGSFVSDIYGENVNKSI